jgi:ubiquinone/menaquinone biosynthesis C-methylase UbiE
MPITLDIGGEGRHPGALNLNRSRRKTLGQQRGQPIPHLVVGRADAIPLADGSVDRVIVERTPLNRAALAEIARVVAPGGVVVLAHVPLPDADRHAEARQILHGRVTRRRRQLAGQCVQETRIEVNALHGA